MKSKKNKIIGLTITVITGVNLIFSSVLAQESANITGSLGIVECVGISCLNIRPPGTADLTVEPPRFYLSLGNNPRFLNNSEERLLLITDTSDPNFNETRLCITDSRETGSFNVSLQMTDLISQTDPAKKITCADHIGVMSFNQSLDEAVSMDSIPEDPSVQSFIEPDLVHPGDGNQTYEQIITSPDSVPTEWITWFDASCNEQIITAPLGARKNSYKMGLAFFINTPAEPATTLADGNYQATATFTLTI